MAATHVSAVQETMVADPNTGGLKAQKDCTIGDADPLALWEVGKVYAHGRKKYDRGNYLRGYPWSSSYDALQRHLMLFWSGEEDDDESGLHHLAHAAWHCLCLLAFKLRGVGIDDRLTPEAVLTRIEEES